MDFSTPSSRWTALTIRNRHADPYFVYAVRTTKIYCRPSCAARLARRANVEFYNTPAAATKAGFRACKRCEPDAEPQADPQDVAVGKACDIIRSALSSAEHANGHVGLNELADRVQLTPSYLHKTFKAKMGMTPKKYAETLRQQQDSAVATGAKSTPALDALAYDAYASFVNDSAGLDFDLDGMTGLNSVIDTPGLTPGGISDVLTSLSTPTTVDWSWLDTLARPVEVGGLFEANIFHQSMQYQDCSGWNDHTYPMEEEILLGTAATQHPPDRTLY